MHTHAVPHDLKQGYYWYFIDTDPPSIIHIHETGAASLMGTDYEVPATDVAEMIKRGETFLWIDPPQVP